MDVSNFADCETGIKTIEKNIAPVDILVNCAGITRDGQFRKMTVEQWHDVISTNLNSVFNVTRNVINGMLDRNFGRVINISFFGHNTSILTAYGWSHLSFLTVTTSFAFLLLGAAITNCAWQVDNTAEINSIRLLPLLIIIVVIIVTLLMWQALLAQKGDNIRRMVYLQAISVKNELESEMVSRIDGLSRMAKRWNFHNGLSQAEWTDDALGHVEDHPGYQSLQWVDKNYRVRWVVPLKGNESALQLSANFEKTRNKSMEMAKKFRHAIVSPTLNLVQGGTGFIIYVPLFVRESFDGFLLAIVRYQHMFNSILGKTIVPGYNIQIYQDNSLIYQRGEIERRLHHIWSQSVNFEIAGVSWRVQVWPTVATLQLEQSMLPTMMLILGLLTALLLGLAIRFAQLAQSRARQIESAHNDLKHEVIVRERAEEAKREMEKVLLQSQKLQAIGTLAGGIAHDFNNILYSITGYVDLVKNDLPKDSIDSENLKKVLEVSKRGQDLVAQILSFSRQHQYKFQPVSLREVFQNTFTLMQPGIPKTILVEHYFCDGNLLVYGNSTQLQQVFVNLMNNAFDAMDGQGKLIIRISKQNTSKGIIRTHPKLTKPSYLVVEFQDTGSGMNRETQERIFEPFFTTKEVGKGTGLGMSIAHGIIHDHEGEIVIDSIPGKGTSFFIYLPEYQMMETN